MRAIDPNITEEQLIKPTKHLEAFEQDFQSANTLFSSYCPDMIEDALILHLDNVQAGQKNTYTINKNKYKVTFTIVTSHQDEKQMLQRETKICFRILQVEPNKYALEFTKVQGDQLDFNRQFEFIRDEVLKFANDEKSK